MPRVYRHFPGFRFIRIGRMEGARFNRRLRKIHWPTPIWMHCDVKSDDNYFRRSERTNWREQGDYKRYPTLDSFLQAVAPKKYGTTNLEESRRIYMRTCCLPDLVPYEPEKLYPYPGLLAQVMDRYPVYSIRDTPAGRTREYTGPVPLDALPDVD
jgi:hypothetical protein